MSAGTARVMAVLLNWRNSADTIDCLRQLMQIDAPELSYVVVDNGSGDGSLERIRAAAPHLPLIASPYNRGFAGGVNQGLQYAIASGVDYALVLNSDVRFASDLVLQLVQAAQADPTLGVLGPKVYRSSAMRRFALYGFRLTRAGIRVLGWDALDTGQFDSAPADAISGCAMLIPRRTLCTVGLFDERFFFSYEDIDYCLRVHDAGLSVKVLHRAVIEHTIGGSTRGRSAWRHYLMASARMQFYRKHWRRFELATLALNELRETFSQLRGALVTRDLVAAQGYLAGLAAGLVMRARSP